MEFTVLIPVYNTKAHNLLTAVDSVLRQTIGAKYKTLIVDDASTDAGTLAALKYLQTLPDVEVVSMPENKGSAAARNYGISLIDTEYVALMDSDDVSHPDRFKRQWEYIQQHKPDVLGCNLFSFYDKDIQRTSIFRSKHKEVPDYNDGWMVNQGTVFMRKQAVVEAGGYNEALRRAQDIDLWKRLYKRGETLRNITDVLYGWRRYK